MSVENVSGRRTSFHSSSLSSSPRGRENSCPVETHLSPVGMRSTRETGLERRGSVDESTEEWRDLRRWSHSTRAGTNNYDVGRRRGLRVRGPEGKGGDKTRKKVSLESMIQ